MSLVARHVPPTGGAVCQLARDAPSGEGPLLLAQTLLAGLAQLGVVLVARFALAPVDPQRRPHEAVEDLTHAVVHVADDLRGQRSRGQLIISTGARKCSDACYIYFLTLWNTC